MLGEPDIFPFLLASGFDQPIVNNSRLPSPAGAGHTLPDMSYRQRILLGNSESSLTVVLENLLGHHGHATFTVAASLDQLLQRATRTAFDAAIVILDQVTVPTNSAATRINAVLDVLPRLQDRGAMPITAMSVYCPNTGFIDRVHDAGADAFLRLPAEPWAIRAAVTAAFDNFVRRESSGMAPINRLAAVLVDRGYTDVELKMAEDRNCIDFRVRRKSEELGRYLKQYDRAYARMLGAIRAAGFTRVGFEELGLEAKGDVVEGGFWVRPIQEVFDDSPEPSEEDQHWLE